MTNRELDAQPTVTAEGVSMTFGDTRALDNCSFSAHRGEIHAIVGENGSGKSTLAKIVSGVLRPVDGRVDLLGGRATSPRQAMRLGLATVFQEILLADNASVVDNVFLGGDGMLRKVVKSGEREAQAADLLHRLTGHDIDPRADVADLELNIKQWIVIARALIRRPKVLILDESTAALDLTGAARLHAEARQLSDEGVTILLVTHRIAELTAFADRATVLRDGRDVGVLTGTDITEERLIELMSGEPADVHDREPAARTRAAATPDQAPAVSGSALQLEATTQRFDFTVERGEVIGLAGLDGHGQANFARALTGFLPLHHGQVEIGARGTATVITGPAAAAGAGVAYISGDRKKDGVFPNMSILENFGIPLYGRHSAASLIDFGSIRKLFDEQVSALGIKTGRPSNPMGSLSGGHQQKVLIGRALAARPSVLVLNDPARGVDIRTKKELQRCLRGLADEGLAVIYVSTELEEFPGFCDRVAVFRDGGLAEWLTGEDVEPEKILHAMFGYAGAAPISKVLEEIA
jgi:ABC-type sugar transport system ATPase subunit